MSNLSRLCWFVFLLVVVVAGEAAAQGVSVSDLVGFKVSNPETKYPRVDNARTIFQNAMTLNGQARIKRLRQALTQIQDACKEDAQLPPPTLLWAKLLFAAGETNSATTELEHATIEFPQEPEAFVLIGELSIATGRLAEAKLAFDQGASLLKNLTNNHPRRVPLQSRIAAGLASISDSHADILAAKGLKDRVAALRADAEKHLKNWQTLDATNPVAFD